MTRTITSNDAYITHIYTLGPPIRALTSRKRERNNVVIYDLRFR